MRNIGDKSFFSRSLPGMVFLLLIVMSTRLSAIQITPSGTADDYSKIQSALDKLNPDDTIILKGNFAYKQTIYIPSGIVWILDGTLTLESDSSLDSVGYVASGVDARRLTGITEKTGGATRIRFSGGVYDCKATLKVRLLNFIAVSNCVFENFTVQNSTDDNFSISNLSTDNIMRNIIGRAAGGNGLTDKGMRNKWYDCVAEDCKSDGWTPKCQDCEFYRCVARNNAGPGFGLYCRLDGGFGDHGITISGNKFYDCEGYGNVRSGICLNISETSGNGGIIRNNFIQGKFYNNGFRGIELRNKQLDGIIENTTVDAIMYGNKSLVDNGTVGLIGGGISIDGQGVSKVKGCVISYGNAVNDVNFSTAPGCTLVVYRPIDKPLPEKPSITKTVAVVDFSCPTSITDAWCVRTYCKGTPAIVRHSAAPPGVFRKNPIASQSVRSFMLNGRFVGVRPGYPSIAPSIIITPDGDQQGKRGHLSLKAH